MIWDVSPDDPRQFLSEITGEERFRRMLDLID
jgi:hypothetical protein